MAKIDTSGWKKFPMSDLGFLNYHGERLNKAARIEGDIPFITAGFGNQGVAQHIGNDRSTYMDPITVDMFGNCFFHKGKCAGDDNVYFFVNDGISELRKMFIASCIHAKTSKLFAYAEQFRQTQADALDVALPIDTSGEPDWVYMDEYMSAVMKESEASLERLKQTDGEKHAVDASGWKEFKLTDIFRMNNTKSIVQKDVVPDSGTVPYVTAQAWNNGVMTYIDCPAEWLDKGDCIMIGGKTLTFSYQAQAFCSNDSHNIALHLKDAKKASEMRYLFLIAALRGSLYQKYSWGDSISMKTIKNDVFQLPVDASGEPDWAYMDEYMRTVMERTKSDLLAMQSIS